MRCVCWTRNPLCVVECGDGGLRTLLRNVAESFAATSIGNTSSSSSKPTATATLLDLEQSNHDCNPESDSQSSSGHPPTDRAPWPTFLVDQSPMQGGIHVGSPMATQNFANSSRKTFKNCSGTSRDPSLGRHQVAHWPGTSRSGDIPPYLRESSSPLHDTMVTPRATLIYCWYVHPPIRKISEKQKNNSALTAIEFCMTALTPRVLLESQLDVWERSVDKLRRRVQLWSGNPLQVINISTIVWAEHRNIKSEIYNDSRNDGVRLYDELGSTLYKFPKERA